MLEAAVDHRWVSVCLERGTRKFEQDDERIHLVDVQLWMGDERLEDVIANRGFLYVSEVGPMCDEVNVCIEVGDVSSVPRHHQVITGKFSEGPRAEAVLQPGAVWGENMIRLRVARETNNQLGRRVEDLTIAWGYQTPCWRSSMVPDGVEDLVGGNFKIGSSCLQPESIEGEGLCVVLVG